MRSCDQQFLYVNTIWLRLELCLTVRIQVMDTLRQVIHWRKDSRYEFKEKPDEETAREYVKDGYFGTAGCFSFLFRFHE